MYSKIRKNLILSAGISIISLLIVTTPCKAQTPTPSPTPAASAAGYTVTSSIELGARGLSVNGNSNTFRSDLNYRAGFRIFDSSFLIEDNTKGAKVFDSVLVTTSGWGSDPQGSLRVKMEKTGIYSFDSSVRRVQYFNDLNTHAVNWSQPVSTGSEHAMNTMHHFGDFDVTIFPERQNFRMRFGYSFSNTDGPGFNTIRFRSDEFQVNSSINYRSQDFRAGVEGKLLDFNLGFTYGHRAFNDQTNFFVDSLNQGNNPASTTASINLLTRLMPDKGTTDFGSFYIQRTFSKTLDFTGRFIYAETNSVTTQTDTINGRASATGNIITLDAITTPGSAKRPQARSDVGLTWRPVDRLRISNTFTFDQFSISGGNNQVELLQQTTSGGGPVANTLTDTIAARDTAYRRFSNLIEADYQVNHMFAFNVGYRFTHRRVAEQILDLNNITGVPSAQELEMLTNTTHSIIAGTRIKPYKFWSIYADIERGTSDNVFTRLANNDFFNFRVRSVANLKQVTFNVSVITKNNNNPGLSNAIDATSSIPAFPSFQSSAIVRTRIFSSSFDWTARSNLSFSGGYTYNQQTSLTDIIVPVGSPIFPTTRFLQGLSAYYMKDSYFFFDVTARPFNRVSLYASYRIDRDPGQGSRVEANPQDFITSYPIRFQMPEIRMAIRLTRNVDWNLGYQYYSYVEFPKFSPFVSGQTYPAQNYTAHLPYTSLRFYFGGRAAER